MDTKNFAELINQSGLGSNVPVVNVADVARVAQSIESLVPMLQLKGKGDVEVVKALDKVAKTLASVSKNITIQNVAVPDAVTVKNQPDFKKEIDKVVKSIDTLTMMMQKKEDAMHSRHMEQMQKMGESNSSSDTQDTTESSDNEIDLEEYRVADSAEPVTGYQYFGFVDKDGAWYIMYNDAIEGKIRYKFGMDNYEANWEMYGVHEYKLLSDAMQEVMNESEPIGNSLQDAVEDVSEDNTNAVQS